jgi:PEP-CTERM motif
VVGAEGAIRGDFARYVPQEGKVARILYSLSLLGVFAFVEMGSQQAEAADYIYTFTSSYGTIQIESADIIPLSANLPPVTFTQGSGTLSNTIDYQFSFVNGETTTGQDFSGYNFVFFPFPGAVGEYATADYNGYVSFVPAAGGGAPDTQGTLRIATVPEPSTWAMMLLGFAGLGYAGFRRARLSEAS